MCALIVTAPNADVTLPSAGITQFVTARADRRIRAPQRWWLAWEIYLRSVILRTSEKPPAVRR